MKNYQEILRNVSLSLIRRMRLNESFEDNDIFAGLEPWQKMEKIRENFLSDTDIVHELIAYMSTDQLEDFTDTLIKNNDLDVM